MSLPMRDNPYTFNDFLEWRQNVNYYEDDPFARALVGHFAGPDREEAHQAAQEISHRVSHRWRQMAEEIARPEERPYMIHYDGHHNRIDRIVRPRQTEIMEREIFSEALFSRDKSPWVKLVKMFLIYQNGEACIACPITCTEGMVEIISQYAHTPELQDILKHCRDGWDGEFAIGAQYLSEIQGGSDVPANLLEAVCENGEWRLYGSKFFCSATHADYAMVTAKPAGSDKVALFVLPSWLPGDRAKEKRNGYTIDRIKWKMGTSELTTAELTFNGALAYPVGPLDRGVANVVGVVLTYSRLTVGLSAAAFMTRAVREAVKYAEFREQFGIKIEQFPLLRIQLNRMEHSRKRTAAGAFKLYRDFLALPGGLKGDSLDKDNPEQQARRFEIRELIMLQKVVAAWDCTDVIRAAMSVFGGHGVMEDFSVLPRLYRDAAVNELWEGPRNVLLTQMHRDFQKASLWYLPGDFVRNALKGAGESVIQPLAAEITALTAHPSLLTMNEATLDVCERWDRFCQDFYHAYQDQALAEMGY